MYHYDCFYICKDLTEGEIDQSIKSFNTGNNTLNTALQQDLEKQVDNSSTQIHYGSNYCIKALTRPFIRKEHFIVEHT